MTDSIGSVRLSGSETMIRPCNRLRSSTNGCYGFHYGRTRGSGRGGGSSKETWCARLSWLTVFL